MKNISGIFMFTMVLLTAFSCSKSEEEHIGDCLSDPIYSELKHTTDPADPKKINFSLVYTGERTLSNVKWTFGDGQTASGATVSHTYTAAGTYEVKAELTTKDGNSSECSHTKNKSITVN